MSKILITFFAVCLIGSNARSMDSAEYKNPARLWMSMYLETIRQDGLGPTVHARNMYHLSAIMYDIWILFHPERGDHLFFKKEINGFVFDIEEPEFPENRDSVMFVTMHYAGYQFIWNRYQNYGSKSRVLDDLYFKMEELGLNPDFHSDNYQNGRFDGFGVYIANQMQEFGLSEPAGDDDGYESSMGVPVNTPLNPGIPGTQKLNNCNRWQPIAIGDYIRDRGSDTTLKPWNYLFISNVDQFLTPHWGTLTPFAMTEKNLTERKRGLQDFKIWNDPGSPPYITRDPEHNQFKYYQWNFALVANWSSHHDPSDNTMIDISPGAIGSTKGLLPKSLEDYASFYDFTNGGTKNTPNKVNPFTKKPYPKNLVKRSDYTRAIAEYWVDGVNTYSPPEPISVYPSVIP